MRLFSSLAKSTPQKDACSNHVSSSKSILPKTKRICTKSFSTTGPVRHITSIK